MLDVNQIMKDLATIVHQQGDTIGKTRVELLLASRDLDDLVLITGLG